MIESRSANKIDIEDAREMFADFAKLPKAVRVKIAYMIEGAKLVSEVQSQQAS